MEETKAEEGSNNLPDREQDKIIFGLSIKPDFSTKNVVGLFMLEFGSIAYLSDTGPLQTFLLLDPNYFNIDKADIGVVLTNFILYLMPFKIVTYFALGFIYDIFGRKYTI